MDNQTAESMDSEKISQEVYTASEPKIDDIYNTPLDILFGEERNIAPEADAEPFDYQTEESLISETPGTGEPEIENPLEALLKASEQLAGSAPLFPLTDDSEEESSHFPSFSPPGFDNNVIPNLPDDEKPDEDGNNSQDDFLRMFPGAKG